MAHDPNQTPDPLAEIEAALVDLGRAFDAAHDDNDLRQVTARYLGKEGTVTALTRRIAELPGPARKPFGQKLNEAKAAVERARGEAELRLKTEARARDLGQPAVDITLPGRRPARGRVHPIMRVLHEVIDVFAGLGFDVAEGPEVDLAVNNFDRLGFPPDHPAMDMHDSFFLPSGDPGQKVLLRTHTSTVQVREMLSHPPPIQVICPGAVFRRDDDVTHSPMFFQLEGLLVDERVTLAELRGVLDAFLVRLFGSSIRTRFRASYFPFVEPGAELDVSCLICGGHDAGCRVCKGTGWLEVLGCGMVHPVVFEQVGYDPERYTGFAFGMGIDRLAMLRYGVTDIRYLYDNDPRFLASL
ncbi:MAG: phenylalanine--tRNA ligase subunit alpha [Myxococcales bacterium]|nr:phenylalanine--tRNA ligase subunit alpha [Myxococcales bacterium]